MESENTCKVGQHLNTSGRMKRRKEGLWDEESVEKMWGRGPGRDDKPLINQSAFYTNHWLSLQTMKVQIQFTPKGIFNKEDAFKVKANFT